jgi:hypothetical protein
VKQYEESNVTKVYEQEIQSKVERERQLILQV